MPLSREYILINERSKFDAFVAELAKVDKFAFDTETTSLDPIMARLVGMSFSWEPFKAYYVPLHGPDFHAREDYVLGALKPIIESAELIGQNIKYDMLVMRNYGIRLGNIVFDTMLAAYLIDPGRRRHNINVLANLYLNEPKIHTEDLIGKDERTMDMVPLDTICEYACEDADVTFRLEQALMPKLKDADLLDLFWNVELPLIDVLAEMEWNGFKANDSLLHMMTRAQDKEMVELSKRIYALIGHKFSLTSPKQLSHVLFDELGLTKTKKTALGFCTDKDALKTLANEHTVVPMVQRYKTISKLTSTYTKALPLKANHLTGKIHTSMNQCVTSTGRLSSSDPNLQNITMKTEEGRQVRRAFVASLPGWKIVAADYSQIELRVLAHCTLEPKLIQAFRDGIDVHTMVAALMNDCDVEDVTFDMRLICKTLHFGIIYGMTAHGLAVALSVDKNTAQDFIDDYFARFDRVGVWKQLIIEQTRERGWVETITGRRRYLPEINSHRRQDREFGERAAVNAVVQGSAADMIKMAMNNVHREILKRSDMQARLLLQVHDELVLECPAEEVDTLSELLRLEMEGAMELSVPVVVDIASGDNWLTAK